MMNEFKDGIKKIYDALIDDESRYLFENRLMFSFTGDDRYIDNVIKTTPEGREVFAKLENNEKDIVVFGAGTKGTEIARIYKKFGIKCFVDNGVKKSYEKYIDGLPVITFDEMMRSYKDAFIMTGSLLYHDEMVNQLLTLTCLN